MSQVAEDLNRFHRVATRALALAQARTAEFLADGFPDTAIRKSFIDYVGCLIRELGAYVASEETHLPKLRAQLPSVPYGVLGEQGHELADRLDRMRQAIDAADHAAAPRWLGELSTALTKASALWKKHVEVESEHLAAAALDKLDPATLDPLGRALAGHGKDLAAAAEPPGTASIP